MKTKSPVRLTMDKVVVRVVQIPMRRPIVARLGEFKSFPYILTDVHTKEGVIGHSYLEPYRVTAAKSIVALIEDRAEQQRGKPVAPFDRFEEAVRSLHLLGRQGVMLIAIAAMDMAMWDALAKALGLPLVVLLGGTVGPVRAYNTNGLWLIPIERLADEASALVAEGDFTALKIRLGRDAVKDDLKAIAEVRRAVGDDIILMGDFNQGLSFSAAKRRLHQLDDQGLEWFEEPIVFDDFTGSARLANELKTPVQIGENFAGAPAMATALAADACDYVMPDLERIGGVTGWQRAAALASAAGIEMSSHIFPEVSAHLLAATPTCHWLEYVDWAAPILAEPLRITGGMAHVPDRPGSGVAWDSDAVKRYCIA